MCLSLLILTYRLWKFREWSCGAMALDKLSVPGRSTDLDNGRARSYCACSWCECGCLESFLLSLGDGPIKTE